MEALQEIQLILQSFYDRGQKAINGTVTQEDIDNAPTLSHTIATILVAIIELDERTKK